MNKRIGTFREFQEHTLAVVRGDREAESDEPKIWSQPIAQTAQSQSASDAHFLNSALRERIVEHVFVGDALRHLWKLGVTDIEVLRSEFDAGGYDLVMSYRKVVRHIQFKAVTKDSKTNEVTVNLKLMEKPSGCVIWIVVSRELKLESFYWLGGPPGEPLPDISGLKLAKQVRANADGIKLEKPNFRRVPRVRFDPLEKLDDVLERLFGPLP
jgi:hypothetical protein